MQTMHWLNDQEHQARLRYIVSYWQERIEPSQFSPHQRECFHEFDQIRPRYYTRICGQLFSSYRCRKCSLVLDEADPLPPMEYPPYLTD